MEQQFKVNIFENLEHEDVQERLRETLFKDNSVKIKPKADPLSTILSLMSNPHVMNLVRNPKKIKTILIVIATGFAIGIFSTVYIIVTQLINLIEYIY